MSQDWYRVRSLTALGSAVAGTRRAAGLTQDDAAHRSGSSRPTISRLERGEPVGTQVVLDLLAETGHELVVVPRGARVRVELP